MLILKNDKTLFTTVELFNWLSLKNNENVCSTDYRAEVLKLGVCFVGTKLPYTFFFLLAVINGFSITETSLVYRVI